MALSVVCLTNRRLHRYKQIANCMAAGIKRCGDHSVIANMDGPIPEGDVAVMWGWKRRDILQRFPKYIYADLGYWSRDEYCRFTVGGWSPEKYVRRGLSDSRLKRLGIEIQPWNDGDEIIIAGSTRKSATDHGFGYTEWEKSVADRLFGLKLVYRPKPGDPDACGIRGVPIDRRPLDVSLSKAKALVTHHSNTAVDALVAGVPVHCEIGAAAAFSVPLEEIDNPPRLEGREQFLADVAWLQWTHAEMSSGACWKHLKGLL